MRVTKFVNDGLDNEISAKFIKFRVIHLFFMSISHEMLNICVVTHDVRYFLCVLSPMNRLYCSAFECVFAPVVIGHDLALYFVLTYLFCTTC